MLDAATTTQHAHQDAKHEGPSGLDRLLTIREDPARRPTVAGLLGMQLEDVEPGRVTFTATARADFGNPQQTLHGGITATLLDSAMTCAVVSMLPAGVGTTTIDLSVHYLRAVPLDARVLRAEGVVVHVGRRLATANGTLTDEHGRVVATATTACMVLDGEGNGAGTPLSPAREGNGTDDRRGAR
jgi:uncharacterized protein (TIGR00369 family)